MYNIYILLHRSDLNIFANMRPTLFPFSKLNFEKNVILMLDFDDILSKFLECFQRIEMTIIGYNNLHDLLPTFAKNS